MSKGRRGKDEEQYPLLVYQADSNTACCNIRLKVGNKHNLSWSIKRGNKQQQNIRISTYKVGLIDEHVCSLGLVIIEQLDLTYLYRGVLVAKLFATERLANNRHRTRPPKRKPKATVTQNNYLVYSLKTGANLNSLWSIKCEQTVMEYFNFNFNVCVMLA